MTYGNMMKGRLAQAIGWTLSLMAANTQAQEAVVEETSVGDEERIVVTGSLIRRDSFSSEQPVEIIRAADAAAQGITTIGELLRTITVASGSPQITAADGVSFVNPGGEGAETLSLRGLGANRTLVLLNGRRAGPAGTRGSTSSFDFNVLPISVIDRVEILKDGASSLYGSDAVAGVVNIITKKGTGGEVNVFTSQPEEDGGERSRLSATWGAETENSSFRMVVDYDKQSELARGQREFLNCGERYIFDPQTGQRADPIDPRTGRPHCSDLPWGHLWIYDYQDGGPGDNIPDARTFAQFDYDGNLGNYIDPFPTVFDPANPGQMVTPAGWFPVANSRETDALTNSDHPFQDLQSMIPESTRTSIYLQGDYQFDNGMKAYSEVLLNRRVTKSNSYRQFWGYIYNETFGGGNPRSEGFTGDQFFSPLAITDHNKSKTTIDYQRLVAGLSGDIGYWYWDASVQHSRSKGEYRTAEIFADAVDDQNFLTGSCVGTVTSVRGVPCVDIPWLDPQFLAGNISQEMRDYLFTYDTGETIYEQSTVEFVIAGDLLELPAGPAGIAMGLHYRTDEIEDTPGAQALAGNAWGSTSAGVTKGDDTTEAVFAELKLPLVADLPGVKFLELTVSGRYTDVESSGDATTYKAGLNWDIGGGVRIRASKGTSFRAPALFELYLADETSFAGQRTIDPCIDWADELAAGNITQTRANNCAADGIPGDFTGGASSATVFTGGGAGLLESETSDSVTYGIVWRPEFLDLSISVDYFDFLIKDEVTQLGATNIVRECYDSEFFPSDPLCAQFERSTFDQRIETVRDQFINIASQKNRGYDLAIDYRAETPIGNLAIQTRHTWQEESSRALFEGTEEDTNGQFGDPKHTATLNTSLTHGDWTYSWGVQYFGSVSDVEANDGDTTQYRGETVKLKLTDDGTYYHSLSVTHTLADSGLMMTLGVANVADTRPPRVSTIGNDLRTIGDSAFYSQYDWLGRRIFADLTYRF